jgi:hypothetical protein
MADPDLAVEDVIDALDSFYCHNVVGLWADAVANRLEGMAIYLLSDEFPEVIETIGGRDAAVLMFSARVAQQPGRAGGLLVVRPDPAGRIVDLTVFLRPLAAVQALAEEMGRRLGVPRPGGRP